MEIPSHVKVAALLLFASSIGGFALASTLTEYVFEKHHPAKGGGNDNAVKEAKEDSEDGKKGKKKSDDDDDDDDDDAEKGDSPESGSGEDRYHAADVLDGGTAVKYLVGKTIRLNPGVQPPRYSYHVARNLMGAGVAARFVVHTWARRQNMLCEGTPQGLFDCNMITVVVGPPKNEGDIALTPKEVAALKAKAIVTVKGAQAIKGAAEDDLQLRLSHAGDNLANSADASNSAFDRIAAAEQAVGSLKSMTESAVKALAAAELTYNEKRAAQAALAERISSSILADQDGKPQRKPVNGEQIATLIIGEQAFPILKGNMLGFPAFIPSIDKPNDAKSADTAASNVAKQPPAPAAPAPVAATVAAAPAATKAPSPPVAKAGFTPPKPAASFRDPVAKEAGFAAPKAVERRSFKSVNEGGDPGLTGKPAFDKLIGKTMVAYGFKPSKTPPYLGFFEPDGHFIQITRDPFMPFEATVFMTGWAFMDGKLCITGALAPPAPVAEPAPKPSPGKLKAPSPVKDKPQPGSCIIPQVSGNDETNIVNIKGEKLIVGANIELPSSATMKIERFGPFRPTGFRALPVLGAKPPAAEPSKFGLNKNRSSI